MSDGISDERPGLFGWVPRPSRARGRPSFEWSREKSNKIMLLFACGYTQSAVAKVIGCDMKTLRKHFSLECREQANAELVVRSGMMARLADQVEAGNVGAARQLDRMIHAERMKLAAPPVAKPTRGAPPKGVKEVRKNAAYDAGMGDDEWGPLLHGETGERLPN